MTQKLCPFLLIAPSENSRIVAPQPGAGPAASSGAVALPCQESRCALFMPMTDGQGAVVGGACTFVALTGTISALASHLLSSTAGMPDDKGQLK